jgi:hypothetical protein
MMAGFEPTIPSSERPQTRALDSAATGIDIKIHIHYKNQSVNALQEYNRCLF